ncbi:MAG: carbohydrate ABC transporter permease [Chloroflexia bacterium]|nr:carbohydrate ABC transporter permease [Chloroflexia bacterium]
MAIATSAPTRARPAITPGRVLFPLAVILVIAFCLAPFAWAVVTSLKEASTIYRSPTDYLPRPFTGDNWEKVITLPRFTRALLNSTIVASSATAISLLVGSLCAYALARLTFPAKRLVLTVVLAVAIFPGIAIISPLYLLFSDLGLINHKLALILPNVTFTLPICIWTLTAFFRDLPRELEEAGRIDGASRLQVFTQIIAPLAAPGIFTTAILLFIAAWNEFLFARTFMSVQDQYTVPVAIAQFEGADIAAATPWGEIAAAAVVATLPLVILVLLFQRRIIAGLTAGAVKG